MTRDQRSTLPLAGPGSVRTSAKAICSLSALRDVNRCAVRPADLISHQGYAVLVTDLQGGISGKGVQGFFLHQTRFLSRFGVTVDGRVPTCVSANVVDHHAISAYHLAPTPAGVDAGPDRGQDGAEPGEVVQKGIELQVNAFVGDGLHVDLIVTDHALVATEVTLALDLAADFADLDECLSGKRRQNALVERAFRTERAGAGRLDFIYRHPELDLAVSVALGGADTVVDLGHAVALTLELEPQHPRVVTLDIAPWFEGRRHEPFYGMDGAFPAETTPARAKRAWAESCTTMALSNPVVQRVWDRAVSDLASLQILDGPSAEPFMIVAGIPNYTGLFGRDAFITGLQTLALNPDTLRAVLGTISRFNAEAADDDRDAEPGKVLHQSQRGPLAKLSLTPFLRYYGDASTPGLFLLAAAADLAHTGDVGFFHLLKPKLEGTLAFIRSNADRLGFQPYQTRSTRGLKNQSWKDSGEAVLHPDGTDVAAPIAMADVQGLTYAGLQALGLALLSVGEDESGRQLMGEAEALKRCFNEHYWMEEQRFFAIALDAGKKQVGTVASDPGACLAYGIVDADRAAAVAERLMAEDMFSGWGIRTLSARHPAYNPFAYHLGTVWPSPSAVTAFGLRRFGFDEAMFRLAEGLFAASQVFALDRLPEVFGGHPRDARHPHPGLYPGACSPQAWSAGAAVFLVDIMLGLLPLAPRNRLVVDPALPEWLPEVMADGVHVGQRRASLRFRREASGRTTVEVLDDGGIEVIVPDFSQLRPGQDRLAARFEAAAFAGSSGRPSIENGSPH